MMKKLLGILALLAGAPLVADAGTVAPTVSTVVVSWDAATPVANTTIPLIIPQWIGGGNVQTVSYYTNGSTPSFVVDLKINGTNVTGCNGLTVTSSTPTHATCTGLAAFGYRDSLTMVISGVSGTPSQALVEVTLWTTQN